MAGKKQATRRKQISAKRKDSSLSDAIRLSKNELRIRFTDSHDLQNKLFHVTQHVANLHSSQALVAGAAARQDVLTRFSAEAPTSVLGQERASAIVAGCVGPQVLTTTALGDIPGLDLLAFQGCVREAVLSAGFTPGVIPASPDNTIGDVIQAIASSPSQ
jgi:hypothetical protein